MDHPIAAYVGKKERGTRDGKKRDTIKGQFWRRRDYPANAADAGTKENDNRTGEKESPDTDQEKRVACVP